MGKSKGRRSEGRSAATEDEYTSDSGSLISSAPGHIERSRLKDLGSFEEEDGDKSLAELIDLLSEKRASAREYGLNQLIKTFTTSVPRESLSSNYETLFMYLSQCLKKGTSAEIMLACQTLSLACVTLGADLPESAHTDMSPALELLAKNHGSDAVRAAAIYALAMLVFIADVHEDVIVDQLEKWAKASSAPGPLTRVAALEGWGLLATTLPENYVVGTLMKRDLSGLIKLLQDEDLDVRIAAGENVALLSHLRHSELSAGRGETEEDAKLDADMEKVAQLVSEMAMESDRRVSKKERTRQRTNFKSLSKAVNGEWAPEVTLKIGKLTLAFSTWADILRLNAFRDALGPGFQVHFERNELLHEIFSVETAGCEAAKLTPLQKRLFLSKSSELRKAQDRNMAMHRSDSLARRMEMLAHDD
eukprot:tig00001532_g9272.t1